LSIKRSGYAAAHSVAGIYVPVESPESKADSRSMSESTGRATVELQASIHWPVTQHGHRAVTVTVPGPGAAAAAASVCVSRSSVYF
jgi:hypothetical protein